MTVTPLRDFHSISQPSFRQTLRMHEAKRVIVDQRNNLKRFIMHRNLTASGAELDAEKAAGNKGKGRGGGSRHPPKKVGLAKSRLLVRLSGREFPTRTISSWGFWHTLRGRGSMPRRVKVSPLR